MSNLKQFFRISLLLLVLVIAKTAQAETGTLSVFVFKNQTPLYGSIVTVDGKRIFKSDMDGSLKTSLPV